VVLQRNAACLARRKHRPAPKLAGGDQGLELGRADLVPGDFHAVKPVLDLAAVHDQSGLIELTDRPGHVHAGGNQGVKTARLLPGRYAAAVVEDLVLRPALVRLGTFRDHVEHHPGIAALADPPIERELEVGVVALGHDVLRDLGVGEQDAVLDLPTGPDFRLFEGPPSIRGRHQVKGSEPSATVYGSFGTSQPPSNVAS